MVMIDEFAMEANKLVSAVNKYFGTRFDAEKIAMSEPKSAAIEPFKGFFKLNIEKKMFTDNAAMDRFKAKTDYDMNRESHNPNNEFMQELILQS